jgi:riboflavin synthase
MFTGIVESQGKIIEVTPWKGGKTFWVLSPLSDTLQVDQSLSHDGICLTVEETKEESYRVTAITETIAKTTIGQWEPGYGVNLERSLTLSARLDGHIVQGHVDTTAECIEREELGDSWQYKFEFSKKYGHLVIEKGSIALNGISLTLFDVTRKSFRVAIIPFTFGHTNIHKVNPGDFVNLEFDIFGKYAQRWMQLIKDK